MMKVQFINPFIQAAHDVFGQVTHKSLELGAPSLRTESNKRTPFEVTVLIGVAGKVAGQVMYSMEEKVAIAIASSMMMNMPIAELDDMAQSAIAEMGNILTGNAISRLSGEGYECVITPPTVIQGKNVRVSTLDIYTLTIPLNSEVGCIVLEVALKET